MASRKQIEPLDEQLLDLVAGGMSGVFPPCESHNWVFTGSSTDATQNITWNYYKCSKCNAEKKERS